MADRPILFSAPMILALLDGRKTQTRRILKLPKWSTQNPDDVEPDNDGTPLIICDDTGCLASIPLRFAKGDRLWVKETHRVASWDEDGRVWITYDADSARSRGLELPDEDFLERLCAKLDKAGVPTKENGFYGDDIPEGLLRRVSIHMPRWASRLTLIVTDVRVERLTDISEIDAMAEGIIRYDGDEYEAAEFSPEEGGDIYSSAVDAYEALWNRINGALAWRANPWVSVVQFIPKKINIDAGD